MQSGQSQCELHSMLAMVRIRQASMHHECYFHASYSVLRIE